MYCYSRVAISNDSDDAFRSGCWLLSVNVTKNSPSRDYPHPDDQTTQTTETPGFKPITSNNKGVHYSGGAGGVLAHVLDSLVHGPVHVNPQLGYSTHHMGPTVVRR